MTWKRKISAEATSWDACRTCHRPLAVMLSPRWGTHQGLVRLGVLGSLGRFQTKEWNSSVNQGCQSLVEELRQTCGGEGRGVVH